jgi:hypothetical protein
LFAGQGAITPAQISLASNRKRQGTGDAVIRVVGALAASAYRRTTAKNEATNLSLSAILEPSHKHGGVTYKGGFGIAALKLSMVDNGMLRQANIGALPVVLAGTGAGRVLRPTLAGVGAIRLSAAIATKVTRPGTGSALFSIGASLDGKVIVPGIGTAIISSGAALNGRILCYGQGTAPIAIGAGLDPNVIKQATGSAELRISTEFSGSINKAVWGEGAAVFSVASNLTPNASRLASGDAIIEVVGRSYIYSVTLENQDQLFYRAAAEREFNRPAGTREWIRL